MKNLASVVITTKNEQQVIEDLLLSIKKQSYPKIEIIVVDNNSTDKTVGIAKRYTKLIFNYGPERSAQRNFGVEKSHGDYILILDADMIIEKDVIKEGIKKFQKDNKIGALIIPEKSYGNSFWAKCKAFEREFYKGDESIEAARFFPKKVFNNFGGYDLSMTGPEDWDLPLRMRKAGVKVGRIDSHILHNEGSLSLFKTMKKKFYYASHARNYLKRHPDVILSHGNLLFRPIFFKKWQKLVSSPVLAIGMFFMKSLEMISALLGVIISLAKR